MYAFASGQTPCLAGDAIDRAMGEHREKNIVPFKKKARHLDKVSSGDNMNNEKYGSLDILLDLDGEIFPMDNGLWVKFTARTINPDQHAPHGIRYSLSLHDRSNTRVICFDNAHALKPFRKKGFTGRKVTWDHKHSQDRVEPYIL